MFEEEAARRLKVVGPLLLTEMMLTRDEESPMLVGATVDKSITLKRWLKAQRGYSFLMTINIYSASASLVVIVVERNNFIWVPLPFREYGFLSCQYLNLILFVQNQKYSSNILYWFFDHQELQALLQLHKRWNLSDFFHWKLLGRRKFGHVCLAR